LKTVEDIGFHVLGVVVAGAACGLVACVLFCTAMVLRCLL